MLYWTDVVQLSVLGALLQCTTTQLCVVVRFKREREPVASYEATIARRLCFIFVRSASDDANAASAA